MLRQTMVLAALATFALVATEAGPRPFAVAQAACEAGDHINGSTAADARKKMEQAGYRQVHDLRKGCDNVWHGAAMKDGSSVLVAVLPQGDVVLDGN